MSKTKSKILPSSTVSIESPLGTVSMLCDPIRSYISDGIESFAKYTDEYEDTNKPKPVLFSWRLLRDIDVAEYSVALSENADLANAQIYNTTDTRISIGNLKTSTRYYWSLSAVGKDEKPLFTSGTYSFTTADEEFRILNIDGVHNARDIGGKKLPDGKSIKQGLIFRTASLDEITPSGITYMRDGLGIRTEIELRHNFAWGHSSLGDDIRYFRCPLNADDQNLLKTNIGEATSESIRSFFEILADKENYPIVFHCYGGVDRTGFCAFLLEGLLGVRKEVLYRDYLLSNFCKAASRPVTPIAEYLEVIRSMSCDDLQTCFHKYLRDVHSVPGMVLDKVMDNLIC